MFFKILLLQLLPMPPDKENQAIGQAYTVLVESHRCLFHNSKPQNESLSIACAQKALEIILLMHPSHRINSRVAAARRDGLNDDAG